MERGREGGREGERDRLIEGEREKVPIVLYKEHRGMKGKRY